MSTVDTTLANMKFENNYRGELFHGVNSYVTIAFHNETSVEDDVDVGYVDKIELNRTIDTITETYIGLYGEPSFNAPTKVEYIGTMRKKLSDGLEHRGGREDEREGIEGKSDVGFFTNSILNFKDGDLKGSGMSLTFDLKIFTIGKGHRLLTIAEGCTITGHKRIIEGSKFIIDEYAFKFKRFKQEIISR